VLAATNKDLPQEIRDGRVPRGSVLPAERRAHLRAPLRERQRRHPAAGGSLHEHIRREYGRRPKTFDAERDGALQHYDWPGNVRELRNLVERLMIMVPGDRITARRRGVPATVRRPAA
jgi:two-component system nitrogen regulation response regulator NtrX